MSRLERAGPVRVVHLPLEAEEEVRLVLDDWATDHAAPIASDGRLFDQILGSHEIVFGGQSIAGPLREQHTLELVCPGLGDRIDDRTGGAPELRIVHAGQDLEFLDRFERSTNLRAGTGAER